VDRIPNRHREKNTEANRDFVPHDRGGGDANGGALAGDRGNGGHATNLREELL
jgi:hypothetical protein